MYDKSTRGALIREQHMLGRASVLRVIGKRHKRLQGAFALLLWGRNLHSKHNQSLGVGHLCPSSAVGRAGPALLALATATGKWGREEEREEQRCFPDGFICD